jgi:hypothetical protein
LLLVISPEYKFQESQTWHWQQNDKSTDNFRREEFEKELSNPFEEVEYTVKVPSQVTVYSADGATPCPLLRRLQIYCRLSLAIQLYPHASPSRARAMGVSSDRPRLAVSPNTNLLMG